MTKLLKGAEVSQALTEKVMEEVKILRQKGCNPTLAIVRVGSRGDDISYERGAQKRCEAAGVEVRNFVLPVEISQEELIQIIEAINEDDSIHGVLLFRPLPDHIDDKAVTAALSPGKDVDGITESSMAGVYSGSGLGFPPCTPRACMEILDYFQIDLTGKKVVVIGRSLVVGKPAAMMAMQKNATVTVCHTKTRDVEQVARQADVLIVAAGKAKSIGAGFVNPNQVIIDVGIHVTDEGKLCGDVDFEQVEPLVSAITPVPGGVGTVTTGVLVLQVIEAAKRASL